jgi:hypothetical protein
MFTYKIGGLYHPDKTRWEERAQFNMRQGHPELLMFFDRPSFDEMLAVKKSPAEFGLARIGGVVFFFYRFGNEIPWSDQAFSIHLVEKDEREVPELGGDNIRLGITVMLVDARTGLIKAIRFMTLSPEYSQELVKLCREDLQRYFDEDNYRGRVGEVYKKCPTTDDLLKECFVFTAGGI